MARALAEDFIDRVSPNRARSRSIPWPLDPSGPERVDVRFLSDDDREAAYFATVDHFAAIKVPGPKGKLVPRKVDPKNDVAFENRERVELIWRAFSHKGVPLAATAAKLAGEPSEVLDALYRAWAEYQMEAQARPVDTAAVRDLVDGLKKNIPAGALVGLPSSWLIAVIFTLVDQSLTSATQSDGG